MLDQTCGAPRVTPTDGGACAVGLLTLPRWHVSVFMPAGRQRRGEEAGVVGVSGAGLSVELTCDGCGSGMPADSLELREQVSRMRAFFVQHGECTGPSSPAVDARRGPRPPVWAA